MSPNLVEPLENIIEDETNVVWNSWAVTVPAIVTSPAKFAVVFVIFNLSLPAT